MNVDFVTAIKLFFANYANFRGRSTRAEYWFATLFVFLVSFVLGLIADVLSSIWGLAVLIPTLAIGCRRFHDAGKSGKLYAALMIAGYVCGIVACIPLAGAFKDLTNPALAHSAAVDAVSSPLFWIGMLLSIVVGIITLIYLVKPSAPDNQYGPNPHGPQAQEVR